MLSALILYHLAESVQLQAVRLEVRRDGAFSSPESSIVHLICTSCWRFTLYAPILPA